MADTLVKVEEFRYYADAAAAKALLEVAGVRAFLVNANSGDLWTGVIGETRIEVPPADVAKARAVLDDMRKVRARVRADGIRAELDACLACKKPMAVGQTTCANCGWTFAGDEWIDYANGPVPAALLPVAYTPVDSRRFGLPPRYVKNYTDWCVAEGLDVLGWELWRHGVVGHIVIDPYQKGSIEQLLHAAATALSHPEEDVCFSMTVKLSAKAQAELAAPPA